MKRILYLTILLVNAVALQAQWATWESPVANIIYSKCTQCHRTGGIAPFTLESYSDAVSNNLSIQYAVTNKIMPPWPPDKDYRNFAHDRSLKAEEIDAINDWVNNGAPSGNLADAPLAPTFSSAWEIPAPDVTVRMPDYTSAATGYDEYRCFVMPSGITSDKYISEIEVIPGNRQAVHHVLVFQDPSGDAAALDAATPEPGYESFGDAGTDNADLVGLWAPGGQKFTLPAGMGLKMNAGADIVIQVHYPDGSAGLLDSTRINIKFADGAFVREVFLDPLLYHYAPCISPALIIPANTTRTFVETTNSSDISPVKGTLLAVAPHMHLIGRNITAYAVPPSGDTIPLIKIPNWDFHWQGMYFFQKLQPIELNTDVQAVAFYDNTSANPWNPSSPPQLVTLGEATTDEMMLVYFLYTYYLPGDEDIIQDSTLLASSINESVADHMQLNVFPNPATEECFVELPVDDKLSSVGLYSITGQLVETSEINGEHILRIMTGNLPDGVYVAEIKGEKRSYTARVLIQP